MRLILLTLAACLALAAPALAITDDECATMWKQADSNNDGSLSGAEADRYAASMRIRGKTLPTNNTISKERFVEDCKADVFTAAPVDAGAPLEGANSFTEGQAKDWVLAAGYSDVSAMEKDDKGIWRGTANKDGKSVKVAVDYKGNVVTN